MQFADGTPVYTADGQEVGRIERVVLDPHTDEITYVVVRKGWLFAEDKVVPIGLIDTAFENRVQLRPDVEDLDELPPFEERYYVAAGDQTAGTAPEATAALGTDYAAAPGLFWYPPAGAAWAGYYAGPYSYPLTPYVTRTAKNIPAGTVALKEGAQVVSADDEQVGKVEQIMTNADLNRATHLLITEGWLFQEKRLIPVDWVRDVDEDTIRLAVTARTLERVPTYES